MKTILSIFGVVPLLVVVWISSWLFTENYSNTWDAKTVMSFAALACSSVLFILKVHFTNSRFG